MEWTSDTTGRRYTTTQGSCQGTVWQDATDLWTAIVSAHGLAVGQNSFTAVEDAQAWCEAEVAALTAAGWCTSD